MIINEELLKQNNLLESIIIKKSLEIQNLNSQIIEKRKSIDDIKSEYRIKAAILEGLRQQTTKMESFSYNYKNNNEEHTKVIKDVENKVHGFLSDKKAFLNTAIISLIESMRNDPEKYSALVYHNNYDQNSSSSSEGHNGNLFNTRRQVAVLPPPPYDDYIIEYYKDIMLEEAEKFYDAIVDQIVCEVVNERVTEQSVPTPSQLPELPYDEGGAIDDKQN